MIDAIEIRELLWEWGRAYPEIVGAEVSWPRMAAFGREVASGHRENRVGVNQERADKTNEVVSNWLVVMKAHIHISSVAEELDVFWLRYNRRWELQGVARKLKLSKTKVRDYCKAIEAEITILYRRWAMIA
ncbi:hypothetical protein [Microbulbifer discodermiae]|uniref:hypothetical protein n=1 Tax=Microbulbifer sp. 2201CG32-9 TaxID=3232309 RepID=UPI00345B4E89